MENKFYIKNLDSYEKASEISKIRMGTEPSYDLDLLPSVQMQKEMRKFLKYRGQQLGAEKFYTERRFYHHLCKMLQTRRDRPESFLDWDKEKWKQQMKIWLLQQGLPLTEISKSHCGNETVSQAKTLHYIDRLIDYFLDLRDADVDEMTKDVWQLEKLDIQVKQDLTRTTRIINFKEISQQDLREEVKKAIYFQLKTESIGTVKKEMTAIRRFSRYLKENNKEVDSCSKLDRKIMEEYLIYMKTEDTGTKRYRAELTRLRALLNMVADVYQYPQVKDLILNRDIPPDIRGEIKIYSDQELKRFNAFLTKVDVQTARLMLIHQMLGTRMSDTLTLRTDCLIEKDPDLHLGTKERENIPLASALHDIGKIAVDDKILNKPGRLTPEEFEAMKLHTVYGAKMLEELQPYYDEPLLKTATDIAHWHHERWDGRGYPDGLVGDAIPLSAQIVSLADVYDALTSERCYKKAYSHDKAVEMILNGECGVFNPKLVECFVEIQNVLREELCNVKYRDEQK